MRVGGLLGLVGLGISQGTLSSLGYGTERGREEGRGREGERREEGRGREGEGRGEGGRRGGGGREKGGREEEGEGEGREEGWEGTAIMIHH